MQVFFLLTIVFHQISNVNNEEKMKKKMEIIELFIAFTMIFYYMDLLIQGISYLSKSNNSKHFMFVDIILYIAFSLPFLNIVDKYLGLIKSLILFLIPTSLALILLYLNPHITNKLIITIFYITFITGIIALIYLFVKIPIWITKKTE